MFKTLLACAAILPLAACNVVSDMSGEVVQPSGTGGSRNFNVADFNAVSLRGADNVVVRAGPGFAVTATGDSALLDRLEIRKDGTTLRIGRKGGDWKWNGDKGATITVTLPRLTAADIAGSGDMTVDRADGDFSGSIAGSGDLRVAELRGGKADLSIAGSGDLSIGGGTASDLSISIAGSGDVDTAGLKAARGDISIAGSGAVRAMATDTAAISIVGSGGVTLTGGAKCSISKMGSGEATCS